MPQLSYTKGTALVGQISSGGPKRVDGRYRNADAGVVGWGLVMAQGTADSDARPPTADTDVLIGVTWRGGNPLTQLNTGIAVDVDGYPSGSAVSLVQQGEIICSAEGACAKGAPVFVRHAGATASTPLGQVSAIDDAQTVLLPGARFASSITVTGIVPVQINIP